MANRFWDQFSGTLEKGTVNLWCAFNVGATGAPTLLAWGQSQSYSAPSYSTASGQAKGVKSITRNSAGKYTIVFQDNFLRVLGASPTFITDSGSTAAAPIMNVMSTTAASNAITNGGLQSGNASVVVQFCSSAGSASDPAQYEQIILNFTLQFSSAP